MVFDESRPSGSDHTGWSDSSARAVLQLMVESVAELVGFEIAALSVVLDGELVTVAYTGPEEHREYMEQLDPVSVLDPVLAGPRAGDRGCGSSTPTSASELEGHWVEFDAGADRPPRLLAARERADRRAHRRRRAVVGVLSVDRPVSGRRPDAAQRGLLERYAAQAERAVLTAFEREALRASRSPTPSRRAS